MPHLVWFRSDLRVQDHAALWAACQQDAPVVALFVLTPEQWRAHGWGARRVDWVLQHLKVLQAQLAELNIPLLTLECPDFAALPAQLVDFCRQHQIQQVYSHEEYEWNERQRDQAVRDALAHHGIGWSQSMDQVLLPPGSLLTGQGRYYTVFTPFYRQWVLRVQAALSAPLSAPSPRRCTYPAPAFILPSLESWGWSTADLVETPPAGEVAALKALDDFCAQGLMDYQQQRDFPALAGTSGLSSWLAVGALSIRQCLDAALKHAGDLCWDKKSGPGTWVSELGWRDFYRHLLVGYPRVSRGRAFQQATEALAWRSLDNPKVARDFAAWKAGQTGFPLVDAAMRQLNQTGWMHNRLRMLVAMFLTKQLLIDWRHGETYFMTQLLDGDLASNNGGWQWAASTGVDAAPYFRIFNPYSQSQKFDPDGEFIRRYLPELAGYHAKQIHQPPVGQGSLLGDGDYPAPCVDLKLARQRVMQAFQALKEEG